MATHFCPECHQPMPHYVVAGVRLTSFKTKLFRFIESHPGQSSGDLAQRFYDSGENHQTNLIRAHIYQINDALMNTGVRISGHPYSGYHIATGSSR